VVNHAAFFISHRLPIALTALRQDYVVDLYTGMAASPALEQAAVAELARYPITHRRVKFTSAGINPLSEGVAIVELARRLRSRRPDIVHCVTPKGVLYGGIAARLAGVPAFVAAVSGQGYAFTDGRRSLSRSIARWAYSLGSRLAFSHRNKRVIVQNTEDRQRVVESGLACAGQIALIPGSGVELERFVHFPIESKEPIVLLPARMLRDKGIFEFVEAAVRLKAQFKIWRFLLAGTADYDNPSRIDPGTLKRWQESGAVEWLGHVEDMPSLYARTSIVCLPSYREGMPKVLLEAAAAGCAVIAADTTGCREAIRPGMTGDLVPARDSHGLAQAIAALIEDRPRRERYGAAGRQLAIERFGIGDVVSQTLSVYQQLLEDARHAR